MGRTRRPLRSLQALGVYNSMIRMLKDSTLSYFYLNVDHAIETNDIWYDMNIQGMRIEPYTSLYFLYSAFIYSSVLSTPNCRGPADFKCVDSSYKNPGFLHALNLPTGVRWLLSPLEIILYNLSAGWEILGREVHTVAEVEQHCPRHSKNSLILHYVGKHFYEIWFAMAESPNYFNHFVTEPSTMEYAYAK